MGMIFPLQLAKDEAKTDVEVYFLDGERLDFTGWTGTWKINQGGEQRLAGALTLDAFGQITMTLTAAQVNGLIAPNPGRGFIMPGMTREYLITNGTDEIRMISSVAIARNKSTDIPQTYNHW